MLCNHTGAHLWVSGTLKLYSNPNVEQQSSLAHTSCTKNKNELRGFLMLSFALCFFSTFIAASLYCSMIVGDAMLKLVNPAGLRILKYRDARHNYSKYNCISSFVMLNEFKLAQLNESIFSRVAYFASNLKSIQQKEADIT